MLVLASGGTAADLTAVMLAGVLPGMLLSVLGGGWADRFSPVRLVQFSQLARALVFFALLALLATDMSNTVVLLGANMLLSALSALANPAYNTLLPRVLSEEELGRGNAAFATADTLAFSLAPALAGAWLIAGKAEGLVAVGGGLLLLMVALLWRVPELERPLTAEAPAEETASETGTADAFRWIRSEKGALPLLLCFVAANLITPAAMVALPLHAERFDHPAAYGWMLSAMGLGALLVSTLLMRWEVKAVGWATAVSLMASGLFSHFLLGLSPEWPFSLGLALLFVFVGDGLSSLSDIVFPTWLQTRVPPEMLGRVFGLVGAMSYATVPVGYLLAPLVVEELGASRALVALGCCLVAVGLLALLFPAFRRLRVRTG